MASTVKYKVSGSYDNKAIKQASKGIEDLSNKAKQLTNVLKAVGSAYVVKKGFDFINKSINLYGEQEKSVNRLNTAIKNNANLNKESSKRLQEYASTLQANSVYGDELIIQQQSMLATMGMTEEQMNKVMQASVDLASSGVMPLDSAVKNISKTYAGMTGELGESIPAMKELTAEQLKAGEGVELIAKMYAGMGESLASGIEGQKQQMMNTIGDIGETIGKTFLPIANNVLTSLKPVVDSIGQWVQEHSKQITNFFIHIPTLASMTFKAIVDVFNQYFTKEFWTKNGSAMWNAWQKSFQISIDFIWSVIKSIGTTLWEPLKFGFESIMWGIKDVFYGIIEWFEEKINGLGRLANKIANVFRKNKIAYVDKSIGGDRSNPKPENNIKENIASAWSTTGDIGSQLLQTLDTAMAETGVVLAKPLIEGFENIIPEYKAVLDQPIKELKTISGSGGVSIGNNSGAEGTGSSDVLSSVMKNLNVDLGSLTETIMGALGSFASIQAVMDPLSVIIGSIVNVLTPVIDTVLAPVLNGLNTIGAIIGNVLAPILIQLTPVMDIVGMLLNNLANQVLITLSPSFAIMSSILEILNPLFKGLAVVIEIVTSPIQFLADLFTWASDQIRTAIHNLVEVIEHPFDKKKRDTWDYSSFSSDAFTGLEDRISAIWNNDYASGSATTMQDINNNVGGFEEGFTYGGEGYTSSGSGSSSSTQVTQVPDITFNFTIEGSLVGEDGFKELAEKILEEGRESGQLSGNANIIIAS